MPETPPLFAPTAIPALSPAPTFADPANFEARADVHVAEVVAMVPLLNAENQKVFANAQTAYEGGQLANAARGLAVYKGPWSTLAGALAVPASVTHGPDNELFMLLVDLADVTAHEPGVSAAWKSLKKSPALPREARTAAAQLTAADTGKWIDITANSFTQTFAACDALGNGWWCYLGNSGTGDITLDPSGAETIDGLATYVMYPGEVRLVQCDGTTLRTFVIKPFDRAWATSGNFVKPPGYTGFKVQCQGGGGGGRGGGRQTSSGSTGNSSGGGGGERRIAVIGAAAVAATETITVGAGGTGGAGQAGTGEGAYGTDGGATSIGTLLSANPGKGGTSGTGDGGSIGYGANAPMIFAIGIAGKGGGSSYGTGAGGASPQVYAGNSATEGSAGDSSAMAGMGTSTVPGGAGGAIGVAGGAGGDGSSSKLASGGGGGGGRNAASLAGGAGGNGGWPGGGGGGGGASSHATGGAGGKGGNGGAGGCFVTGVI